MCSPLNLSHDHSIVPTLCEHLRVKMGLKSNKSLKLVSGWKAIEILFQCVFLGIWQFLQVVVMRLWKGPKRKDSKCKPVELTVDSAVGTHCYIKILGSKYHYVKTGPKTGQIVLVLGDAPNSGELWSSNWKQVVKKLVETGHCVITLDLRGTGGSEGGNRHDLSPPRAVHELTTLLNAIGVSEDNPAIVIGFGIGGMLTWYLVHCEERLISKFVVVGSAHPNHYWQHPPAKFCEGALHFIQWPYIPERWLLKEDTTEEQASIRACDWTGPLNYVRGAAWWRVQEARVAAPALLVAPRAAAAALVSAAQYCGAPTLRLVPVPQPIDRALVPIVLDFIIPKEKCEDVPQESQVRSLMGRMFGAVAGRGRELTAKLALPAQA